MREDVFRSLFDETHTSLFRYARRRLSAETAGEVVSDTYVTVWRKQLQDPRDDVEQRQMRSLLYRVLEGHMRNASRSEQVRTRLMSQLQVEASRTDSAGETALLLEEVMGVLDPEDRRILSLYTDGFRTSEIADILGCTVKAAGMRLVRARKALQAAAGEVLADERR